jgi:hypothetical protein
MGKPAATDRPCLTPLSHSITLDCNIYVASERAGKRVMQSVTSFIWRRLQLKVKRGEERSGETAGAEVSGL